MRFFTSVDPGEQMRLPHNGGRCIPTRETVGQLVVSVANARAWLTTDCRPLRTARLALLARRRLRTPAELPGRPARCAGRLPPGVQAVVPRVPASASACGSLRNRCRAKDRET